MARRGPKRCLLALACGAALAAARAAGEERRDPLSSVESGFVEREQVRLLLLDVEVTDAAGNPRPGLRREDFSVRLNGKSWPLYSVDDLCTCERTASPEASAAKGMRVEDEPGPAQEEPAPAPIAEPTRYVLYIDYGLVQQDGRARAVGAARRFVQETMRPGDLVMLAAYADKTGLRIVVDFTSEPAPLLAGLERTEKAIEFNDTFCTERIRRIQECQICCGRNTCNCAICFGRKAREEYFHSRHALEALQHLLARLEHVPGPKRLVFFHQDGTQFPARYYGVADKHAYDHLMLVDQIAADANLARTTIHVAFTGLVDNELALNLGANLADATGGSYNRTPGQLDAFTDGVRRGCACIYRLALLPPPEQEDRILRARVEVQGRELPHRYLVEALSDAERWWRDARAILDDPESATEVRLTAGIVPLAARVGGWDLRLLVALDPDALLTLPGVTERTGRWEVGALFADERSGRSAEMLGVSELHRQGTEPVAAVVLHERRIDDVKPGDWKLRAFVRDRTANAYGGAAATLDLPKVGKQPTLGPLLVLRGEARYVRTALPPRKRGEGQASETTREVEDGPLPLGGRAVRAGEPLELVTWFCPGERTGDVERVARYVAREGRPLFRFDPPRVVRGGDCAALTDRLDTAPMEAGHYTYEAMLPAGAGAEALRAEVSFDVVRESGTDLP